MAIGTKSLRTITAPTASLPPDVAAAGLPIPPIERLRHMSAEAWEDFIFEWAHSLKSKYARIEQCAGAGDMGRDIVAFEAATAEDPWDNYQCKRYEDALSPADIWLELGKLTYYTFIKEYSFPRKYFFVAPRGAGNKLSKLLRRPDALKNGLLGEWEDKCRKKITSTKEIPLDDSLRTHIDKIDFSIFFAASPLTIIEEHKKTPWYVARFGGGLPLRVDAPTPPPDIRKDEINYVRALLDAYEERLGATLGVADDLSDLNLQAHLSRARREFYSAESLREFSRDNVPSGTFEHLLDDVYDGVIDVVQAHHPDAYERVLAAVKQAKSLPLTSNALMTRTGPADRGGMCHQLANGLRLKWRR